MLTCHRSQSFTTLTIPIMLNALVKTDFAQHHQIIVANQPQLHFTMHAVTVLLEYLDLPLLFPKTKHLCICYHVTVVLEYLDI